LQKGHYFDYVKVLDFGLVKTVGVADLEPGLTAPNHSVIC
jgi:hypothetical protein